MCIEQLLSYSFQLDESIDWVDALSDNHYVILDDFLEKSQANQLREIFEKRLEQEKLKKAGIGESESKIINDSIRGDKIYWLDTNTNSELERNFLNKIEDVMSILNRYCFLSLSDYEFHYAHYKPGTFYKRHLDQFKGKKNRLISSVFYMNKNWKQDDAGQLRIYKENSHIDIEPIFNRLVLFKSDVVEHEVLKTFVHRYSITGWMLYRPMGLEIID